MAARVVSVSASSQAYGMATYKMRSALGGICPWKPLLSDISPASSIGTAGPRQLTVLRSHSHYHACQPSPHSQENSRRLPYLVISRMARSPTFISKTASSQPVHGSITSAMPTRLKGPHIPLMRFPIPIWVTRSPLSEELSNLSRLLAADPAPIRPWDLTLAPYCLAGTYP